MEAIERLMEGRTTFIIAHRLSTVRGCDRILVLRDGTIAERAASGSCCAAAARSPSTTARSSPRARSFRSCRC